MSLSKAIDATLKLNDVVVVRRASDGYVNATLLCQAGGKLYKNWHGNRNTQLFLEELATSAGIPADLLIISELTGENENRGTWVHPQVAINIAQWISPKFNVQVSKWIYELATFGKVKLGKEHSNEEIEQMRQQLASIQIEKQLLLANQSNIEAIAVQERQQREAAEAKYKQEQELREAAEAKAREDQAALAKLQAQVRMDEIQHRFNPIKNPNEFYASNGYLYLETSEDDFKRSIIGFGMTSEPIKRLAQYHSKATGAGRREFLKVWKVWNMPLVESVVKEILYPWANPDEKQKPIHKRSTALSKIEIFDIPYQTIYEIVNMIVIKFQEIITSLKSISAAAVAIASGPFPAFEPIKDIAKYIEELNISAQAPVPPSVAQMFIAPAVITPVIAPSETIEQKLTKYIQEHPPSLLQGARAYYIQVRAAVGPLTETTIREELAKQDFVQYRDRLHILWRKRT